MSLSRGPADYAPLVPLLSWPGVVLGAAFGAVGWRAHRIIAWGGKWMRGVPCDLLGVGRIRFVFDLELP